MKINENQWKAMKINENQWKSLEINIELYVYLRAVPESRHTIQYLFLGRAGFKSMKKLFAPISKPRIMVIIINIKPCLYSCAHPIVSQSYMSLIYMKWVISAGRIEGSLHSGMLSADIHGIEINNSDPDVYIINNVTFVKAIIR